MGKRVSFIRVNKKELPTKVAGKSQLLDQVFNPDRKDGSIVVDMDKSLPALFFMLSESKVGDVESGLVSEWKFKTLYEGDITVYYQDSQQVGQLNEQFASIDQQWVSAHYDAHALMENKIYPDIWDGQGYNGLQWLSDHFGSLQQFYRQAAAHDEVVIAIPT